MPFPLIHTLQVPDFTLTIALDRENAPVRLSVRLGAFSGAADTEDIGPDLVARFARDLRRMDETLQGEAVLREPFLDGTPPLRFTVDRLGYVQVSGCVRDYANGTLLQFSTAFDQTYLRPFASALARDYAFDLPSDMEAAPARESAPPEEAERHSKPAKLTMAERFRRYRKR